MDLAILISILELGIIGFLFWKANGPKISKDIMDLQERENRAVRADYERQINILRQEMKEAQELNATRRHDLGNKIQVLTLKVGHLEGSISEKDKKIEELTAILQNRNPQLDSILIEIKDFMQLIHQKLDMQEKRSREIDVSTRSEKGKVLRRGAK